GDLARQLRALETASQSAVTAVVAFADEASEAKVSDAKKHAARLTAVSKDAVETT
uniref:Acidic major surface glycoprotein (Fragments) n=1 Tax=Trypanosoma congolense TaxID=5692 RepID=Q9TXG2_TRYCO